MFSRLTFRPLRAAKKHLLPQKPFHTHLRSHLRSHFHSHLRPLFHLPMRTFWGQPPPPDFDPSKDYYKILGVSKTASKADIKKKYFEYVKTMHPDRNPNADQDRFKELTGAYNLLSNEEKRKQYDQYRQAGYGETSNSSSYGAKGNPYGDGFNPFGQQGRGQQQYYEQRGPNGQRRYYYYKGNPEDARKHFEEFFKRSGFGQNFRQGQGNFKGFEDFMKTMRENMEKQQREQQQQYNNQYNQQNQNNQRGNYKDPREEFYEYYRQHGVPPAGVLIMRFIRNFIIIYFCFMIFRAILGGFSGRNNQYSMEDMYQNQIMQDTYEKNMRQAGQQRIPPGHFHPSNQHPPHPNQAPRFYDPSQDPYRR